MEGVTARSRAENWGSLAWTRFVAFDRWAAESRTLPSGPGLYRVRVAGTDRLAYIGQTGRGLRQRLHALRHHAAKPAMPFNDPHTAAPCLWAYRVADGLEYEASAVDCDLDRRDRLALECYLLWQHRLEAGRSTLGNFGRTHPRYTRSKARKSGRRGIRLPDGDPDSCGSSAPACLPGGVAGQDGWLGLRWSPARPFSELLRRPLPTAGVYAVSDGAGEAVYIGQSSKLTARFRLHARHRWGQPVRCSFAEQPADYSLAQLLEVENDLIGGYYAAFGRAPARQFGTREVAAVG